MTFEEIYHEAFTCILEECIEYFKLPRTTLWLRLKALEENHGREAIVNLWGWYHWALENGSAHLIWISIAHDLRGAEDEKMKLKTGDYAVKQWGEGYTEYSLKLIK